MTFYQLAFRYLKRKKAKVILLFFILLVVSSMILSTNMILEATKDSKAAIQEKAKAKIVLEVLEENNQITTQEVKEILKYRQSIVWIRRMRFPSIFTLLQEAIPQKKATRK